GCPEGEETQHTCEKCEKWHAAGIPSSLARVNLFLLLASRQKLLHHFTMHIGKAKIAPLEAIGQPGMIEPEQVQDGGVQVVHMHLVRGRVESKVIRLTHGKTRFNSSPRHPHRKAVRMMVAPIAAALHHRGSA